MANNERILHIFILNISHINHQFSFLFRFQFEKYWKWQNMIAKRIAGKQKKEKPDETFHSTAVCTVWSTYCYTNSIEGRMKRRGRFAQINSFSDSTCMSLAAAAGTTANDSIYSRRRIVLAALPIFTCCVRHFCQNENTHQNSRILE